MKNFVPHILYIVMGLLLLSGCSTTKYVPENQYLLDKVEIESDNKAFKSSELRDYLHQRPNFKVFGLMKWQLYVYNWSGRNDKRWVNKQLRRMGEPPVIMDTTLIAQSEAELERFLVNKGYINAEVTHSIDTSRVKKAIVTYYVSPKEPYRIRNYRMSLYDKTIDSIARIQPPKRSWLASAFHPTDESYIPLVKDGDLFDRDVLDKERGRITSLVRRRGYYAFNRDNLTYLADSSFNANAVELEMLLKPYRRLLPDGSIREENHRPYYIDKVSIMADYDPLRSESQNALNLTDTLWVGNIAVVYGKSGHYIRPSILAKSLYLSPGRLYNERSVEQTYSSFSRLRALKNINIRFTEREEGDSLKLDCAVLMTPTKLQGFGVDLEGTNSAGDLGFASSVNYQHRNLFKGSEAFMIKFRGRIGSVYDKIPWSL